MSPGSRRSRAGLVGAAIAFARSPTGQRLIGEARRRVDTPENRARLRQMVADRRRPGAEPPVRTTVRATDARQRPGGS